MSIFKREKKIPIADAQVLGAFSVMHAENPQWVALNEVLDRQIQIELDSLLVPNLTDSAAQYNRGRVAALESFRSTLMQIWQKSQEQS